MIDPSNVPEISPDEILARYVLQNSHLRADRTIKPNAFMPPPPNLELSVTRHLSTSECDLWAIGEAVAIERKLTLYGRGDVDVKVFSRQSLSVRPDPISDNPNHAVVLDWPDDKPTQKNIAQEIAAVAKFVPRP
jgi:hypothetical protein